MASNNSNSSFAARRTAARGATPMLDDDARPLDAAERRRVVDKTERLLADKMKPELTRLLDRRDEVYVLQSDYLQLRNQLLLIDEQRLERMRAQVNLGCDFFIEADVADLTYVNVNVGLGFYLQLTRPEALAFIERKERELSDQSQLLSAKIAELKANMKLLYDGLYALLAPDNSKATKNG